MPGLDCIPKGYPLRAGLVKVSIKRDGKMQAVNGLKLIVKQWVLGVRVYRSRQVYRSEIGLRKDRLCPEGKGQP